MKRFVTLVALLVLIASLVLNVVLVTGRGVSQDSYDAAVKEVSDLKAQLSNVQANLTSAQADLTKSKADLATVQQNLTTITAERDSAKSQLDKAKADLATAQANLSKSSTDLTTAQQSFSTLNTSVKTYQYYVDATNLWFDMMLNWNSWDQKTWDAWDVKLDTAVANSQDSALQTLNKTMETKTGAEHIAAETAFANMLVKRLNELKPKTQ